MNPCSSARHEALLSISDSENHEIQFTSIMMRIILALNTIFHEDTRTCRQLESISGFPLSGALAKTPSILVSKLFRSINEITKIYEIFSTGKNPHYDFNYRKEFSIEIEPSSLVYKSLRYTRFLQAASLIRCVELIGTGVLLCSSLINARKKISLLPLKDQRAFSPYTRSFLNINLDAVCSRLTERDIAFFKIKKLQGSYYLMVSSIMHVFLSVIELYVLFTQKSCWNIELSHDQHQLGCWGYGRCDDQWTYVDLKKEPSFNIQNASAVISLIMAVGFAFFSVRRFSSDFYTAKQERQKLSFEEDELLAKNFKPLFLLKMTKSHKLKEI